MKKKLVFVTGAGRGIGRAIALHLASQYVVSGCARSTAELESAAQESGGRIRASHVDVTSLEQQQEWMRREVSETGAEPWGLVTAAGIYGPIGPFLENDLAEWRQGMDINLYGTMYSVKAFASMLVSAKLPGRIVLLSGGGATKPMPNFSNYCASKAAVVRWGETVALELIEHGITVNSLAPGAINTKLTQEVLAAGPGKAGRAMYEGARKQAEEGGQDPRRAAELVAYLLGPDAARVNARLISAIWDPWSELHVGDRLKSPDLYTLRRVAD